MYYLVSCIDYFQYKDNFYWYFNTCFQISLLPKLSAWIILICYCFFKVEKLIQFWFSCSNILNFNRLLFWLIDLMDDLFKFNASWYILLFSDAKKFGLLPDTVANDKPDGGSRKTGCMRFLWFPSRGTWILISFP